MTKEIALHCMRSASELERELCEECPIYGQTGCDHCYEDALRYVIAMIEQEPKTWQFAEWVATEIFDENWEYNKDAFAELACRKLAKLGIVRAKGNEWELVKPQESEEK